MVGGERSGKVLPKLSAHERKAKKLKQEKEQHDNESHSKEESRMEEPEPTVTGGSPAVEHEKPATAISVP